MNNYLDQLRQANLIQPTDITYPYFRMLEDGITPIYITRLAFTWALHIGDVSKQKYCYRFCFPQLSDAIKAFQEIKERTDIPTFGWVAARPENRLMLSKYLINLGVPVEVANKYNGATIDEMIEDGIYTVKLFYKFNKWEKRDPATLDKGVIKFLKYLKSVQTGNQ